MLGPHPRSSVLPTVYRMRSGPWRELNTHPAQDGAQSPDGTALLSGAFPKHRAAGGSSRSPQRGRGAG